MSVFKSVKSIVQTITNLKSEFLDNNALFPNKVKLKALIQDSENIVNNSSKSLLKSQTELRDSLRYLGNDKLEVLDSELKDFVSIFSQVENISLNSWSLKNIFKIKLSDNVKVSFKKILDDSSKYTFSPIELNISSNDGYQEVLGAYAKDIVFSSSNLDLLESNLNLVLANDISKDFLDCDLEHKEINLDAAVSNKEKAEQFALKCGLEIEKNKIILNAIELARQNILNLSDLLYYTTEELNWVVNNQGFKFKYYNAGGKYIVLRSLKLASLVELLINISILDRDGNLLKDTLSELIYFDKTYLQNPLLSSKVLDGRNLIQDLEFSTLYKKIKEQF
ncbi:MAG: hypothetical protein R3Y52_00180 [Psittacicella sp.]